MKLRKNIVEYNKIVVGILLTQCFFPQFYNCKRKDIVALHPIYSLLNCESEFKIH